MTEKENNAFKTNDGEQEEKGEFPSLRDYAVHELEKAVLKQNVKEEMTYHIYRVEKKEVKK